MERVRQLREARGWSQARIAMEAKISRQAVAQYERGERVPAGDILVRLAKVFGVSSAYLLGKTDSPERDDRLPEDWEAVVEEAMSRGHSPEDVRRGLRMLRMALGKEDSE